MIWQLIVDNPVADFFVLLLVVALLVYPMRRHHMPIEHGPWENDDE